MLCICRADAPASPTEREVASLRLPVFDREVVQDVPGRPAEGERPGETLQTGKAEPAEGSKSTTPFLLGEGLPPIPAKLVVKIQKGDFVDMAELLRDNIEADRRRSKEGSIGPSTGQQSQSRREVPDILSWVQCFGIYISIVVVVQLHPEKTQQLLAYQTMLLREARRCGGNGWQTYDTMFRQQVANNPTADWSKLNSSLYAVNFLANQNGKGRTCQHCLETDHSSNECALASTKAGRASGGESSPDDIRGGRSRWERGDRKGRSSKICFSWNDGRCAVPYCDYRHICAKCSGEHKAIHCTAYPPLKGSSQPPKGAKKE